MMPVLALTLLLACAHCLTILSPPQLAGHVPSPTLSAHLGQQSGLDLPLSNSSQIFDLVLVKYGQACTETQLFGNDSTYVLLHVQQSALPPKIVSEIRCLTGRGAAGVIVVALRFRTPGVLFYDSRYFGNNIKVPVLHAASVPEMAAAIQHLSSSGSVTIFPDATSNPWLELWGSTLHLAMHEVIGTVANVAVCLIAVQGLVGHLRIIRAAVGPTSSNWLAVLGCSIEAVSAFLRALYNAAGAFQSSSFFPHVVEAYFMDALFAVGTMTTYIAAALFIRWNAFTFQEQRATKRVEMVLVAIGVSMFVAGVISSSLNATIRTTITIDLIRYVVALTVVFVSSVAFLVAGSILIRRFKKGKESAWRSRALKKAISWMMVASVSQFVQIGAVAAGVVNPENLRNPKANFVLFVLATYGLIFTSGAHAMAFRPLSDKLGVFRKPLAPKIANAVVNSVALAVYGNQPKPDSVASLDVDV